MPPPKLFRRKGRTGFYFRDRRAGKDAWYQAETRAEAKRLRDRVLGSTAGVDRLTVGEAAKLWLETLEARAYHPLVKARVERELVPALGMRPLGLLTDVDCRTFLVVVGAKPKPNGGKRSPQTVLHIGAVLRSLLLWCAEKGLVVRSPFPRGLMPRVGDRRPDPLTEEEEEAMRAIEGPHGFYLRLLLGTGIRWGEAVLTEAAHVQREQLHVVAPKTGKARWVPLSTSLRAELSGRVGRLVHLVNADSLAVVARERTGIERFHVHQTRHTYACRWLEAGGSLTALQEILGHSRITTTQIYGRPSEQSVLNEARRILG